MRINFLKALFFTSGVVFFLPVNAAENNSESRDLHDRVLTLDTHVDIPLAFSTSEHMPGNADAQVSLQGMREGGLDAAFFIVYVGQETRTEENYRRARADALTKFDAIHRMIALYPDQIGLATNSEEAEALSGNGMLVALIGIENGFAIGTDISLVEVFYDKGGRYMTLVHNGHNDIGDSAQPQSDLGDSASEHGGLSDFGRDVVVEMNRVGMLVDVSHVSKDTMMQATALSRAPVIASHSSVKALTDHPRNMDDEQLLTLKDNGGVIQIVAFNPYLDDDGEASVKELADHIDYAVSLIGIEHVGISSDFGGGGGITGWENAEETPNITLELLGRGYSEEEIGMLWSGNVLRILDQAAEISENWQ